jgi:hypothetical protein
MNEEDLELACDVMGQFINSKDPKFYTKETLINAYDYGDEDATELTDAAYREWSQAYGA